MASNKRPSKEAPSRRVERLIQLGLMNKTGRNEWTAQSESD